MNQTITVLIGLQVFHAKGKEIIWTPELWKGALKDRGEYDPLILQGIYDDDVEIHQLFKLDSFTIETTGERIARYEYVPVARSGWFYQSLPKWGFVKVEERERASETPPYPVRCPTCEHRHEFRSEKEAQRADRQWWSSGPVLEAALLDLMAKFPLRSHEYRICKVAGQFKIEIETRDPLACIGQFYGRTLQEAYKAAVAGKSEGRD